MSTPASVNVNPQSSTEATSGATSGGGNFTFAFGGNPNLAFLNSSADAGHYTSSWLPVAGIAAAVLIVGALLWRRR
jgi:LPXTG-motif cell wall-anchored protein